MPAQLSVAVQGGASIPDGGTDAWPDAVPLETSSRVYTLSNPGDADLIGTASIAGAGFSITAGGSVFIPAGGTASLFVEADPMAVGTYTATVTIASDLPAYEFDIALSVEYPDPGTRHTVYGAATSARPVYAGSGSSDLYGPGDGSHLSSS